ncbi:universal stress protein [Chloroflexota bacterium]
MYERILVPLDGSRVGEAALPHVEKLVSRLSPGGKVEVTLLQVLSSMSHFVVAGEASAQIPYTEQEMRQIRKKAMDYLNTAGKKLRKKGAVVKTRISVGSAADEIISTAEKIRADWIAMSTHGRSGISRWAFGSVTDRVLRGGNKPVLIVRAPKETAQT